MDRQSVSSRPVPVRKVVAPVPVHGAGAAASPALVTHVAPIRPQTARPLWQDLGWREARTSAGTEYVGEYRVSSRRGGNRQYRGRIERRGSGNTRAYVQAPPAALLTQHPARACFHPVANDWVWMNWHHGTPDTDKTIQYMERVLTEAVDLEVW